MTLPQNLKINDIVILAQMPESVIKTTPRTRDGADGIKRVYQRAIDRRSKLKVSFTDEFGRPWVEYVFRNKKNQFEHHAMLIDDDSYNLIPNR